MASANLVAWKNAVVRTDPLVTLYEISVTDALTEYLVQGNPLGTGEVVYQGNTYRAVHIEQDELEQNVEGDLPAFRVAVSNIDGVAGGYIEQYDLSGRKVKITHVLASTLDPADSFSETYTIQDQEYDRRQAVFTLSHANYFTRKVPTKQFTRHKCRHSYEQRFLPGNGCGYPRDEFEIDTRQDFRPGGTAAEKLRQFGWYSANADKASLFDVDSAAGGVGLFGCLNGFTSAGEIDLTPTGIQAPWIYKKLDGDFDVYTQVSLGGREGGLAGILAVDQNMPTNWAFCGRILVERFTGGNEVVALSSLSGIQGPAVSQQLADYNYLRLKRVGATFTFYTRPGGSFGVNTPAGIDPADDNWSLIDTRTLYTGNAKIGLVVGASPIEQGEVRGSFPWIRFYSGGLPLCSRTIDGANGCREHSNQHRFFAFLGIPIR